MNDRQRLEAIVAVVCQYLPPDGISREEAISQIISLVDPLPEQEQWDTSDMAHRSGGLSVEQAEKQEPVAWTVSNPKDYSMDFSAYQTKHYTIPLYTSPPKCEWVGLTDEEIDEIYKQNHNQYNEDTTGEYEREIESKLRERNQ
jgi:hypothetical protein